MVDQLGHVARLFKVGKPLFLNGGPELIREIRRRGAEIFLDLKFHRSPRVIAKAALEATRLGVKMFDLYAAASTETMERVRAEVAKVCRAEGLRRPQILAVALLTPLASDSWLTAEEPERVARLAKLASDAALDGVLVAAADVAKARAACGPQFIIAATGLRLEEAPPSCGCGLTVYDAVRAGADYVVMGGPVWSAGDPVRAVRAIIEEMERGFRFNSRTVQEQLSPRGL